MYIDWVGDQPELLLNPHTGEVKKVYIFATTLGVSSLVYAECFLDEKLPSFMQGTSDFTKDFPISLTTNGNCALIKNLIVF